MLRLPKETPLVGFHAKVDVFGMVSLGLILVDTLDKQCQYANWYEDYVEAAVPGEDQFEQAEYVEGAITDEEMERAQALEAILLISSIEDTRKSQDDIKKQIEKLHQEKPIQTT